MRELKINASSSKKLKDFKIFVSISVVLIVINLIIFFLFNQIYIALVGLALVAIILCFVFLKDLLKQASKKEDILWQRAAGDNLDFWHDKSNDVYETYLS